MTQRVSLRDVVNVLPSSCLVDLSAISHDHGLHESGNPDVEYVWPDLLMEAPPNPGTVLLIKAPGAMGKSMAADAISSSSGALHVNLANVKVGANSITGLLVRSMGFEGAHRYASGMQTGQSTLLLDSLDEAALAAGRDHFWAFLEDVMSLLGGSSVGIPVIILGRPDSISAAELVLEDKGFDYQVAELAPLTESQAYSLTRNVLDATPSSTHRNHPVPFRELWEYLYRDLAHALDPSMPDLKWSEVEYFLGYPPVVVALAQRLSVDNPILELSMLTAEEKRVEQSVARGILLKNIVEVILDRESAKVQSQLGELFTLPDHVKLLYTREEQILRVIQYISKENLQILLPAFMDVSDRQKYDERLAGFVPDHPFRGKNRFSNEVFSDYVRAYVATGETTLLHGADRARLLALCDPAGPFFVHFCFALVSEGGDKYSVDESIVDSLTKSFTAGSRGDDHFSLLDHGNELKLSLYADRRGVGSNFEESIDSIDFTIKNQFSIIEFQSPLARAFIVTNSNSIVLGSAGSELELGPDVAVFCDELEIQSRIVTSTNLTSDKSDRPAFGAFLVCQSFSGNPEVSLSVRPDSRSLLVNWPNVWYPWLTHMARLPDMSGVSPRMQQLALVSLRKILIWFRRGHGQDPRLNVELVEKIVVGENLFLGAILEGLVEIGAVVKVANSYELRMSEITPTGFSFAELKTADWQNSVTKVLSKIATTTSMRNAPGWGG
ncbi:hypothetical protein [Rhodococcoides fascians]|nr:hypothetical protein [Rhodococcus fascians]